MSPLGMLITFLIVSASSAADVQPAEAGQGVRPQYGWPRPWPWWPTTPSLPPTTPSPPPTTPSPPTDPWWCNRTYGSESYEGDVDCQPPPPPPPAPTTPSAPSCPWPCLCPRLPPRPRSVTNQATATTADCAAPLAAVVNNCGAYLTATGADDRPALPSPCCDGVRSVLNMSAADDTAAGGGDGLLVACVCPLFLGDTHKLLRKPVDPERLLYLPIACNVGLPPAFLYACYAGRTSAPVVKKGD